MAGINRWSVLVTMAGFVGCAGDAGERSAAVVADSQAESAPVVSTAVVDSALLIRPDGIGAARPGVTLGQLRTALGAGWTVGPPAPFMVDLPGLPVVRGADTLYYVLFAEGDDTSDAAVMPILATTHARLRTAEGVGPGSTLAEAAALYGEPTLSYNTNDESREYASFPGYAHPTVRFRVQPAGTNSALAGIYSTQQEHNVTGRFDRNARIMMVMIELPW